MNIYVLMNRETRMVATRDCMGQHDGKFSDDVADAKEFSSYGEASDYGQNFDDNWQPEALFDEQPNVMVEFMSGARCSELDDHPFSGAVSAGDY